jgi:hypothetical protein
MARKKETSTDSVDGEYTVNNEVNEILKITHSKVSMVTVYLEPLSGAR